MDSSRLSRYWGFQTLITLALHILCLRSFIWVWIVLTASETFSFWDSEREVSPELSFISLFMQELWDFIWMIWDTDWEVDCFAFSAINRLMTSCWFLAVLTSSFYFGPFWRIFERRRFFVTVGALNASPDDLFERLSLSLLLCSYTVSLSSSMFFYFCQSSSSRSTIFPTCFFFSSSPTEYSAI